MNRAGLDEQQVKMAGIAVVALVATVALAGCMGIGGGGGQSISDAQVKTVEDTGPALVFNYSVDDYSTVLLEGPDDNIINERELSPDGERSGLYMADPRPGEYELVLRQGENTITTETLTFEGPNPEVTDVSARWSGSTIQSVSVTVRNDGDLPAYVDNASFSARGESVESSVYQWIGAGNSTTLNVSTSYGGTVDVEEAGDVRGSVEVVTDSGTLTGSFEKVFQGPNLTITETNGNWNTNRLESVDVTVRNDGDMPTTANVTVERGGEALGGAADKRIPAGATVSFEAVSIGYIYQAESGGTATLDVIVNSPTEYVTDKISHELAGANVTIESLSPSWQNGKLESISFTAANGGEVSSEFDAELTVNGETVQETPFSIGPSTTTGFEMGTGWSTDALYTASSGGSHEVTLTLSGDGWTDTATSSTSFEGTEGEISSVSTTFLSNYESDTSDLTSADFAVWNTGDLKLSYDSVEISIDGVTNTHGLSFATELAPGESTTEYVSVDITVPNGEHELTIRLMDDGEAVLTETTTVSTGS